MSMLRPIYSLLFFIFKARLALYLAAGCSIPARSPSWAALMPTLFSPSSASVTSSPAQGRGAGDVYSKVGKKQSKSEAQMEAYPPLWKPKHSPIVGCWVTPKLAGAAHAEAAVVQFRGCGSVVHSSTGPGMCPRPRDSP